MPDFAGLIKYPTASDVYNSSYGEPQWWRDLAITARAEVAQKVAEGSFIKPFSGTGGDFNDLREPGLYGYWSDWANRPSDTSGSVIVFPPPSGTGQSVGQVAFPYGSNTGIYYRFSGGSGTWSGWTRLDAGATGPDDPTTLGAMSPSSLKRVPLALTAATASGENTNTEGSIRFPIRYGARITRWRIHVRNHNYASGVSYSSTGNINGVWFGPGTNGAFAASPNQVASAMTVSGSDTVTPWINTPIEANQEYVLSMGWTSTSAPKVQTAGGGWTASSSSSASAQSASAFSVTYFMPYDWWIEAETEATTPTVAGYGDSITAGTGTDQILATSWLSQFARQNRALPIHWAYPGSGMSLWLNASDQKWSRWNDFPQADAVIHFMGQNDLGTATTAAIMKQRFDTVMPLIKEHISPNVFAATITPHAGKTSEQNAVRRQHANYLRTLPLGLRELFDFAAAVSSDDIALKPEYRGGPLGTDELHPNTAGGAAMAATINRPIVTENPASALTTYLSARGV